MTDRRTRMPQPLLGVIALPDLLIAQVVGAAVWACCALLGVQRWPAIGIGVAVGLALLVRVAGKSTLGWLATAWRFWTVRNYTVGQPVDFRSPDGRSLGLCWDGTRVTAVIEVLPPRGGLTRITKEAFDATHRLPVDALASSLIQHDIVLDGIDIISHGHRSRSGTPAGGVYEQLIGPLPAVAERTVWLAVSLDAAKATEAVERRGGGREGASRAVTVASARILRALDDAGCRSRFLTAPEVREAVLRVTGGANPRDVRHSWTSATLGEAVNVGASIQPSRLGSDLLAKVWVTPARGTTVAVRLRPGATPDVVGVGAAWRVTSRTKPERIDLPGRVSVNGRQRDALLAHLPIGVAGIAETIPIHGFPIADIDRLQLPSAGCGQLVGADDEGQGIATRIVGSGIATVHMACELYVAQQVVFRALAVGARVLIRTDRPQAWASLVESIASADRLAMADESQQSSATFNATIVDGVPAPAAHAGVTTIHLTTTPARWPDADADVTLVQPDARGNRLVLETGGASVELTIVTIPRESAFIGTPRSTASVAGLPRIAGLVSGSA